VGDHVGIPGVVLLFFVGVEEEKIKHAFLLLLGKEQTAINLSLV
jgi:hypothetical protein